MRRKEKASVIKTILDDLFPSPPIPLNHDSHFTLLIAVLLSAQCTDERVNKITKYLFAAASTPEEMASLPVEEIEKIIQPCGLYRNKAKAISSLSKILLEKFQGEVPSTLEELESLPGVGHKTASVVLIQGFSIPAFPVDTHIHRCAKRWGLSIGKNVELTEKDLKKVFPKKTWILLHLQIIYYARAYCPAKGHKLETCPICQKVAKIT
jgi:endonuclease III